MDKKKKSSGLKAGSCLCLALFSFLSVQAVLFAFPRTEGGQLQDLETALRVANFLDEVERYQRENRGYQNKIAEFSEAEVSSFFRYVFSEESPTVKTIELKLLPANKIEGWILLNLKDQGLPSYFKEEINLYFVARLETDRRRVRLDIDKLYFETEPVHPAVVNSLIDLIARSNGLEAQRLDSWYELPAGILDLKTARGKLLVYY
ncbi:MAG TPA: hypothetical protein PK973_03060 [Candidatus Saccharicenans sp.]|nr:hypothetical protein [Candidatus Saccharicenans sp.]HUM34107.1 hypothetical protein [Candidatus Saccharicenans sp.]